MPGNDQPKRRPDASDAGGRPDQARVSRRSVLGAAGVGAAGLATGAFGLAAAAAPASAATKPAPGEHQRGVAAGEQAGTGEHVVVHLRDDRSGNLDVYRGTSHTSVHDPALAARIRGASAANSPQTGR